jgi:hypothetical protein
MKKFSARIQIIGVNPYVLLPSAVLDDLFKQAEKNKGPIPVRGKLNGHSFIQTLVKYSGKWRLYLNTPVRKATGLDVGDKAEVQIEFDPEPRTLLMHSKLKAALNKNKKAQKIFEQLSPSLQKEIIRYIGFLKTEASVDRNVKKAILFLMGKERFVGRNGIK